MVFYYKTALLIFPYTDEDDDIDVQDILAPLKMEELKRLFRKLGLSSERVNNRSESGALDTYRNDLIKSWILEDDKVQDKGGATWESLRNTLTSIGKNGIANKI